MATGLALIVAIGSQNAFVLRCGIRREHVLPIVLFCAASDALLIAAGVGGAGALLRGNALATHFSICCGIDGANWTLLGTFGERCNDGGMSHVRFSRAIDGRNILHGVKIRAPIIRNRTGIIQI